MAAVDAVPRNFHGAHTVFHEDEQNKMCQAYSHVIPGSSPWAHHAPLGSRLTSVASTQLANNTSTLADSVVSRTDTLESIPGVIQLGDGLHGVKKEMERLVADLALYAPACAEGAQTAMLHSDRRLSAAVVVCLGAKQAALKQHRV